MTLATGGLAMLVQVRVTELPSETEPDESADTVVFLGGSERKSLIYFEGSALKDHTVASFSVGKVD